MKLIFVRHGKSLYNHERRTQGQVHEASPLLPESITQAKTIGPLLVDKGITHVYVSDLMRAAQTWEAINETLDMEATFDERLRERSRGKLEGILYSELQDDEDFQRSYTDYEHRSHGGESIRDLKERVEGFLAHLSNWHGEEDVVLLVGHGWWYKMFHMVTHNLSLEDALAATPKQNLEIVEIDWA